MSMSIGSEPSAEPVDYNSLTVTELRALCKERGLTGYSSLLKAELIALLEESDNSAIGEG